MTAITWKAPKSVYKKLDDSAGQIRGLIKQRESKNLKNVFTSSKKLNDELNKKLASPVKEISELFCHYAADSGFSTLCLQIDEFLQSYKKKYGVNVFIKVPNTTPYYQIIQKNLYEAEKNCQSLAAKLKVNIEEQNKKIEKIKSFNQSNVNRLSEDIKVKNFNITSDVLDYTVLKDEYKDCILKNEEKSVEEFKKCLKEWKSYLKAFTEATSVFSDMIQKYDMNNIKSDAKKEIDNYKSTVNNKISEFSKLIDQCAQNCNAKLEWFTIKDISAETVQIIQNYTSNFAMKPFNGKISTAISGYDKLNYSESLIDKGYKDLIELFKKIQSLISELKPLQSSLETRKKCQSIFVFDKHASSMDENNAKNLERRRDTSKLQSVFDIVFNSKDIEKQNLIPYIRGSAAWILIDNKGDDFKESRLKMPYKRKDDFQRDLRALYNK